MPVLKRPGSIGLTKMVIKSKEIEERYEFSSEKWTRIWFTTKPGVFIPEKQMNSMNEFLNNFPSRKITLIYDSRLFDESGKQAFLSTQREMNAKFSDRMQFLDFSSQEFKDQLSNDIEKTLYSLADKEVMNLQQGGNVAAASDIVRTLRPAYISGIYTDFDVTFPKIDIEGGVFKGSQPFLFSISPQTSSRCNDVIAVDPACEDNKYLKKYQSTIIEGYNELLLKSDTEKYAGIIRSQLWGINASEEQAVAIRDKLTRLTVGTPFLFAFRKVLENEILSEEDPELKKIYKSLYMKTVMILTGPSCLPETEYDDHCGFQATRLGAVLLSQADGIKNDGSWIPGVAIVTQNFREEIMAMRELSASEVKAKIDQEQDKENIKFMSNK